MNSRLSPVTSLILILLLLLVLPPAQAQGYMPYYTPGYGAPQPPEPTGPEVWAEGLVSEDAPYLQQTVIYTLRIHHRGGIASLDPTPVNPPGLSFVKIDGPVTDKETVDNRKGYVSDFRYALTPLKDGKLEIPAIEVLAKRVEEEKKSNNGYGAWPRRQEPEKPKEFTVSTEPMVIEAKPRADNDHPWLPLYGLTLEAELADFQRPRMGEPLTLVLTQTAWGAGGDQLPTLTPYLESLDFKVYADRPQTSRTLSERGNLLQGQRKETFTLIPRRPGQVKIPAVQVVWWNLAQDKLAWADWEGRMLLIEPPEGFVKEPVTPTPLPEEPAEGIPLEMWMLLVGLASFFLGWWVRAGSPGPKRLLVAWKEGQERRAEQRRRHREAKEAAAKAPPRRKPRFAGARRALAPLAPARVSARVRAAMPHWVQVRALRLGVEAATTPYQAERRLQAYAHRQLGLRPHASVREIGARIASGYPQIKQDVVLDRFARLDTALYAPNGDKRFRFRSWMRDIRRILRSIGSRPPRPVQGVAKKGLPPLNPDAARQVSG